MQTAFDFGGEMEIVGIRDRLAAAFGRVLHIPRRIPIGQLIKSLISSRTKDEVSLKAYERLTGAYANWSDLAEADTDVIKAVISEVKFAEIKAPHLREALRLVAREHPDFDLDFLGKGTVDAALAWLETLPGVGRKVAASALNFSTLECPAFVVDTHVLRVLRRFGFVGAKAGTETAYQAVMQATPGWSAFDLAELHILIKGLGQTVCRHKTGACSHCPISDGCRTAAAV